MDEAVIVETGDTSDSPEGGRVVGSVDVLQNVQRDAHQWGVGDPKDVPRLELRHSNEGKSLSPGGDEVPLNRG